MNVIIGEDKLRAIGGGKAAPSHCEATGKAALEKTLDDVLKYLNNGKMTLKQAGMLLGMVAFTATFTHWEKCPASEHNMSI